LYKYPKFHLQFTLKAKIWANSRNYPAAIPTFKGGTAADILLKACGGGFQKSLSPLSQNGSPQKSLSWVTYATMDCKHRWKHTHQWLPTNLDLVVIAICD